MTSWEYKTLNFNVVDKGTGLFTLGYKDLEDGTEAELAELGRAGWELVAVLPFDPPGITAGTLNAVAFFKRELASPPGSAP